MNILVLPILVPLFTAILLMVVRDRPRSQFHISLLSGGLLVVVNGYLASQLIGSGSPMVLRLGGWDARIGITWIVDGLSALMLLLSAIISLTALLYAPGTLRDDTTRRFHYPLQQFLLVGVNGSFLTGDLFNLFVFFEIMLLTSFVQMMLGRGTSDLRKTAPYVLVNVAASMLFLLGVGFVYAGSGTVNLALMSQLSEQGPMSQVFWIGMGLVLLVLSLKAGIAPLFFWLPDSYPRAPLAVSALFAGILTKVGVYTLYRVVSLVGAASSGMIQEVLLVLSLVTMMAGVLGALGSTGIRDILSFHIVSQVGYMVLGLALFTKTALAAGIFYVMHHMIAKTALFFVGGVAETLGVGKVSVPRGGLASTHVLLACLFFVPAMALAGMPPFSGFWAKLFLLRSALASQAWLATFAALFVSLLTLASMLKIWNGVFWGTPDESRRDMRPQTGMTVAMSLLVAFSIGIGLLASPLYDRAAAIADELLSPRRYVDAIIPPSEGGSTGP